MRARDLDWVIRRGMECAETVSIMEIDICSGREGWARFVDILSTWACASME